MSNHNTPENFEKVQEADRNVDEQVGIAVEDRAPFSMLPDWIVLADIKPQSKQLYSVLLLHINVGRSDGKVWPSQSGLAELMGYSSYDKIKRFMDELVTMGAVRIDQSDRYAGGFRQRNHYYVRQNPPEGWQGPTSIAEYYRRRGN